MFKKILTELEHHAPFTLFGAFIGILVVIFTRNISHDTAHHVFFIIHPAHVFLSAYVTTSMYRLHAKKNINIGVVLLVGYIGSIGIATLSDSIIPFIGESLLGLPHAHAHVGFVEAWWLINPLAVLAILIAYIKPTTHLFHSGHVFLSTWASLFHIIMAMGEAVTWPIYTVIFLFLFLAVWLPCCLSDIIFPVLLTGKEVKCEH